MFAKTINLSIKSCWSENQEIDLTFASCEILASIQPADHFVFEQNYANNIPLFVLLIIAHA